MAARRGRDEIQEAVDQIAKGINQLIKADHQNVPGILRMMARDIERCEQQKQIDRAEHRPSAEIINLWDHKSVKG